MKQLTILLSSLLILYITACTNQPPKTTDQTTPQDSIINSESGTITDPAETYDTKTGISYNTYCNERYGFCIDYPKDLLIPQGESGSGDGQVFLSASGQNTLTVYRDFSDMVDPDSFTLKAEYEHDIAYGDAGRERQDITYKKAGSTFFVISGYSGDKIFYQKTILTNGQLATCILTYNKSEKDVYNKISEHVFQSFK